MTKHLNSFLAGLLIASVFGFWFERRNQTRVVAPLRRRRPRRRAASAQVDLNEASLQSLLGLPGLDRELVDRIIENRPYRNKLDLIARLVISEEAYEPIKHLICVAPETREAPVKAAGRRGRIIR